MAIGDRIEIARQNTLESVQADTAVIKNTVGTTNNAGGGINTGTVMGKLNAALQKHAALNSAVTAISSGIADLKNNTNANHSGNASGNLSQKITYVVNLINTLVGAPNHTGGSATAGTVMGKLNTVINALTNSVYGLNAIKSSVRNIMPSVTGEGATLYDSSQDMNYSGREPITIAKAIAPADGIYALTIILASDSYPCSIYRLMEVPAQPFAQRTAQAEMVNMCSEYIYPCSVYFASTIGTRTLLNATNSNNWASVHSLKDACANLGNISKTTKLYFHANKGEPILLMAASDVNNRNYHIQRIAITYQQ